MRPRKRSGCRAAGGECAFNVARAMTYHSPDGQFFRVRRLVCKACGRRELEAKKLGDASDLQFRPDDGEMEANF